MLRSIGIRYSLGRETATSTTAQPKIAVVASAGSRNAGEVGETRGTLRILACGLLGGFSLGVLARAWMRLISEKPEFSWTGTLVIVVSFTVFGVTQSVVAVTRRHDPSRRRLTIVRVIGAAGMLPLFGAAGAVMIPTVIGGGFARARVDWRKTTRGVLCVVAAGPVFVVGHDLVGSFGWSMRSVVGFIGLGVVYAAFIWATQFTFAPQLDGWRLPRWARWTVPIVAAILFLIPLYLGGGIK